MSPEDKVKWLIVARAYEFDGKPPPEYPNDDIESLLDTSDYYYDACYEVRGGDVETNIPSDSSRHYESKSVASKLPDGSWVGWTYWYGGGKYGEPEAIDWIEYAYDLKCKEEEKLVVVRKFAKV